MKPNNSLEFLSKAVALGIDCESESVKVVRLEDSLIYVHRFEVHWHGSIADWQAALLAALSAKFVEGPLVIEAQKEMSHGIIHAALETAKKIEDETKRTVIFLGSGWRSMSREEAEQALRALM